jgi:NDP-sugar pyrophosphorylase family protein
LRQEEISALSAQGNHAADWNMVIVHKDFSPDHISGNQFHGRCVLGFFSGKQVSVDNNVVLLSGIHNCVISNSEIGNECLISRAGLIANCLVMEDVVIYNVGSLICTGETCFGNGNPVSVGVETCGREVAVFADITIEIASTVALNRSDKDQLAYYNKFVNEYVEKIQAPFSVVEQGAVIQNTHKIENCFVGKSCHIDGATLVQNCTILSSREEPVEISHGAIVRHSILQWGCEVTSLAIIDNSVLTEHSHVERHGKVSSSIIGPNTGVAEGEVTACLLGPFIGFHHQSLLIAALWPEGKGNVAYGANVGSNHTSKAPDQEILCGEGTFFGLGTNIKFPANFAGAPYSLFATAVCTLPQRIDFPFSLINTPAIRPDQLPPLFNQIFPGWVLYNNIYAVMRNEGKYVQRNKARRSSFVFEVFRADIADKMVSARNRLTDVKVREMYTEKDIPGLGKNFLIEESRLMGVRSYTFYIEYYCLKALIKKAEELISKNESSSLKSIIEVSFPGTEWEHARKLLISEGYASRSMQENCKRFTTIHELIAADTETSKTRDDERGRRIVDDYNDVHACAHDDAFVKEMWKNVADVKLRVEKICRYL